MIRKLLLLACLLLSMAPPGGAQAPLGAAPDGAPLVLLARVEGVIGPATAQQVSEAITTAGERNAAALVLMLNTPGGLVDSTREIIIAILAAEVPVIGYVAPAGAHAASAGTYILYATHAAAMAPATNIGAATPIQVGGGMPELPEMPANPLDEAVDGQGEGSDGNAQDNPAGTGEEAVAEEAPASAEEDDAGDRPAFRSNRDALSGKQLNDAVAFLRSLAELRGRNAEWAEAAVREAATLTASAALENNVIEAVAGSLPELLTALDGRTVKVGDRERPLVLKEARVEELEPSLVNRLLAIIANPNVALILMMIGVYGLIFEFSNPGTIGPGVLGAICLVMGLYALNQLPLDYAGLALIGLGIAFMVAEAVSPSFGVLGLGGLAAFIIGAAMLIDTDIPAYQLSWTVIIGTAVVTGAVLMVVVGFAVRSFRAPVRTGNAALHGEAGQVTDWSGNSGYVHVAGERWRARAEGAAPAVGAAVEVLDVHGLELLVRPLADEDNPEREKRNEPGGD